MSIQINTYTSQAACLMQWETDGIVSLKQKLGNFVSQLQNMMDVNQNGDYLAYIDPTVIAEQVIFPEVLTADNISDKTLENATIGFEFEDGLPCINSLPFWERLDGEPIHYYKIFEIYRNMKYDKSVGGSESGLGIRSLARVAELISVPGRLITILSRIYHWIIRVKSFDIFKSREIERRKQYMAEELETKHSRYSNEILEQAFVYLAEHDKALSPKIAVQMIELGMKYGRISVGLQGDKPGSKDSNAGAAVHQTNIGVGVNFSQAPNGDNSLNGADGDIQGQGKTLNGSNQSAVERQLSAAMKDPSTMVSVLKILSKSGALKEQIEGTAEKLNEEEYEVIDSNEQKPVIVLPGG